MKTKTFTFLELLNVIEGRASTPHAIEDSQRVLSHLFNMPVHTHDVPFYLNELRKYNPLWLAALRVEIETLKAMYMTRWSIFDFRSEQKRYAKMIDVIRRDMNYPFETPQLREFSEF